MNVRALSLTNGSYSSGDFSEPSQKVAKSHHDIKSAKKPTINSPIAIARYHTAAKLRKAPSPPKYGQKPPTSLVASSCPPSFSPLRVSPSLPPSVSPPEVTGSALTAAPDTLHTQKNGGGPCAPPRIAHYGPAEKRPRPAARTPPPSVQPGRWRATKTRTTMMSTTTRKTASLWFLPQAGETSWHGQAPRKHASCAPTS